MGHRLTKIYTKTGDTGMTGLGDGQRVLKDSARIEAIGTIDEANSAIGLILSCEVSNEVRATLQKIQQSLFNVGGELCIPGHLMIFAEDSKQLESKMDDYNKVLPRLKEFILPGGGLAGSYCHLARAIVRRAERCVFRLHKVEPINPETLKYLNRLSDYLFVAARMLAKEAGCAEVLWERK